jgi:Ras-related GTP-binding protein C/D
VVADFPNLGNFSDAVLDYYDLFKACAALVFVIDVQEDYLEALHGLFLTASHAHHINPKIYFEVFIHKVDGLSDDFKIDTQRDILQRLTDDFMDAGLESVYLSFYLTSIYDHSIFEAFSKVVQKLIPQLPTLESLLNILCSVIILDIILEFWNRKSIFIRCNVKNLSGY